MLRQLRLLMLLIAGGHLAHSAECLEQAKKNAGQLFQKAAIVIGIPNPTLAEGPAPVTSAKNEFDTVAKFFARQPAFANNVYTLEGAGARSDVVTKCLELVAANAALRSTVIVFVSARGYYDDGMDDGYLLTADTSLDKLATGKRPAGQSVTGWPGGNGVALSTLARTLARVAKGGEVYLFLDLCRSPEERPDFDNKINGWILNKQFYRSADTQRIIVATKDVQRSLPNVFADSLVTVIPPGRVKFEELFEALKRKVLALSGNKQTPVRPPPPGSNGDGCLLCKLSALPGPLLASAVPMASFAEQNVSDVPADVVARRIDAAHAEADGQEIFVRYGEGNHFPGDPLAQCENPDPLFSKVKLCAEQFEKAAQKFSEAAGKYQNVIGELGDADGDRRTVASLEERARFSRAQVLLLRNQFGEAQAELEKGAPFAFAESHNLLGISYLEQGAYEKAETEFRAATGKARYWGYPRHNLALALIEHGNYGAAERAYREAIATTPVGERFQDTQNSCFAKRRVLVGARPYLYYNLGVLLQRLNRLGEARTQFCLAEASFRLSLNILKAQGALSPPANPVDGKEEPVDFEVELATKRAIAAQRNLADVKNSQGVLLQMRGKRKQAAVQFKAALDANPRLLAAKYNWAQLKEKKEPDEAKKLYREILADAACQKPEGQQELSCGAARKALDPPR